MAEVNEDLDLSPDTELEETEETTAPGGRNLRAVEAGEETLEEQLQASGLSYDMLPPELRQMAQENPQQAGTVIANALNLARNKLEQDERSRQEQYAKQQEAANAQAQRWFQDTYQEEFDRAMEAANLTQYSSQADIQKAQQRAHLHALDAATSVKADMIVEAKLNQREQARLQRQAFLNDPSNQDLLPFYGSLERLVDREGFEGKNVARQIRQMKAELEDAGFEIVPKGGRGERSASTEDLPPIPGFNPLQNTRFREIVKRMSNPMANQGSGGRSYRNPKAQGEKINKGLESMFGPRTRKTTSWLD